VLISSHVLYNSIKLIDQAAVDYLELLSRRTQLFNLKTQIGSAANPLLRGSEFPSLTWVVKDFIQVFDALLQPLSNNVLGFGRSNTSTVVRRVSYWS
jgi:hypothetical protein